MAVARSQANTAKIIHESPGILRMKELEALVSLASKEGNVLIVPGLENVLSRDKDGGG